MNRFRQCLEKVLNHLNIAFSSEQIAMADAFRQILLRENEKMNLTAIVDDDEIALKHFGDSLCLLKYGALKERATLIDIGSGPGFPGLALKIFRPDLRITLMDSLAKRCHFLEKTAKILELPNLTVLCCRAEEAGRDHDHREQYDYATARAVATLPVLLEYALPLLKAGGEFLPLKGKAEEQDPGHALKILCGTIDNEYHYNLMGQGERTIYRIKKIGPTPEKYPRRVGKPGKSPL